MLLDGRRGRYRIAAITLVTALVAGIAGCGTTHKSPGAPAAWHDSATASPTASADATGREEAASQFKGLPVFDAPPTPEPITVPATGSSAPIYSRIPTRQKVAFLTMDDGQTQLPIAPVLMRAAHVPFTMFLIAPVAAKNPAFFKQLTDDGGVIEDHTLTHPIMRGLPADRQKHEICGARDSLHTTFGITPRFFRPPYGNYDHTTLASARGCGLQVVFNWSETVNGGKVYYQTAEHKIQPGDIILMHFRPAFQKDVIAALTAIHDSGLTPALLEDYIAPAA